MSVQARAIRSQSVMRCKAVASLTLFQRLAPVESIITTNVVPVIIGVAFYVGCGARVATKSKLVGEFDKNAARVGNQPAEVRFRRVLWRARGGRV